MKVQPIVHIDDDDYKATSAITNVGCVDGMGVWIVYNFIWDVESRFYAHLKDSGYYSTVIAAIWISI